MESNEKDYKKSSKKKMGLVGIIFMIFVAVFGFGNVPLSFYKMGYAAIPWYIISAVLFFVPYAFMISEFGSAFKNEQGGIYSWMAKSVGPKFAFVGTFMWYASNIIWMVMVSSSIWIPVSNFIFGSDTTQTWKFLGIKSLSGPKTIGIMGILWIIFVSYVSSKGLDKIKKFTDIGGVAVVIVNIVVVVGALAVFFAHGCHLAEPIQGLKSFTQSPNHAYAGNPLLTLAFVVYALFAYGGIEAIGGVVDETENPEKNFPKGVIISAAVITIGYSLTIFLVGMFTNWNTVMTAKTVNQGNTTYAVMANLGYTLAQTFGASQAASVVAGQWMSRIVAILMFLPLVGAFFTLTYSPLKQLIDGTPKELWPGRIGEVTDGIPKFAMAIQAVIVCVLIALTAFGGDSMAKFFDILVAMSNVATTLPCVFIAFAFGPFKKNSDIKKPFKAFKSVKSGVIWSLIVTITVALANFFCIIQPAMDGDMPTSVWSAVGPILFTIIPLLMFRRYEKKYKSNSNENAA